jgi:hypothetical protein
MKKLLLVIPAVLVLASGVVSCQPAPAPAPTTPSPPPEKTELGELRELERNIVIEAEEETFHYLEEKNWAENEFSRLMKEPDKFSSNQIERFKATYQMDAGNFDVQMATEERATILKCDVYAQSPASHCDFQCFTRPLGLDFFNDRFERSERGLSWQGSLDGVKTTIQFKFPSGFNDCHARLWRAK